MTFEEDLVGVAAFLSIHAVEAEVIDDEKRGSEELSELLLVGVGESGVLEGLEHAVGAKSEDGIPAATGEMSESVSEEGFADPDVADDS
jgi:hypothetical protein